MGGVRHCNGLVLFFHSAFSQFQCLSQNALCDLGSSFTLSTGGNVNVSPSLSLEAMRINENMFSNFMLLRKDGLKIEDLLPCILRGKYAEIKYCLLEEIESSTAHWAEGLN